MLPALVGEEDVLLLVVSQSQWNANESIYENIFKREDHAQLGIAIVDDKLLPEKTFENISHRRLLSMRIAFKLLDGVDTSEGFKLNCKLW